MTPLPNGQHDVSGHGGLPLRQRRPRSLGVPAADVDVRRAAITHRHLPQSERCGGTAPAVIDQASLGACISLGRRSGMIQFARRDDTAVNLCWGGRLVAPVKEAVCRSTIWMLRREASRPGSAIWFKGGNRPEQPAPATVVATKT
jgi:hypothetical protein